MKYATLTNSFTGCSTRLRLEPNNYGVTVKNYRAALRRINATGGWRVRSDVEFCTYDRYGGRDLVSGPTCYVAGVEA